MMADAAASADDADEPLRVIRAYAAVRLRDHAVRVLRSLEGQSAFVEVEEDEPWPHAGPRAEAGLIDEMFWLFSTKPAAATEAYAPVLRRVCEGHLGKLCEAETDFLWAAVQPQDGVTFTIRDLEVRTRERLVEACLHFLRNYDRDALTEWD